MYTPKAYVEADLPRLHACMRAWSFATLVTQGRSGCQATHLPFLLDAADGTPGTMTTHMARANAQLADLEDGAEALVLFQGPHAFISPSWYANQNTFPTWNYAAIHVRGQPRLVTDAEAVRAVLTRTVDTYDTPLGGNWRFDAMPEDMIAPRLRAIVAIEIPIASIEGKLKFNQDKSPADRAGVIAALERSTDPQSLAVARLMREQLAAAGPI